MGEHSEVPPGVLRLTESKVETQGSTAEGRGDGGPPARMLDVGPVPRALQIAENGTLPAPSANHRVPLQAQHIWTTFVRPCPHEDQSAAATVGQQRLLFAAGLARQPVV